MQSDKPVLVTGASGFVGSHTARLLAQRGRTVRVLLRKTSNAEAMQGLPVEVFHGDVLDPASLRRAMEGCGSVFYSVVDPRFWLTDTTPYAPSPIFVSHGRPILSRAVLTAVLSVLFTISLCLWSWALLVFWSLLRGGR